MTKCEKCGKDIAIPFKCSYCWKDFCTEHRLPYSHNCEREHEFSPEKKPFSAPPICEPTMTSGKRKKRW